MAIVCEPDEKLADALFSLIAEPAHRTADLSRTLDLIEVLPGRQLVLLGPGVDLERTVRFMRQALSCRPDTTVLLLRDVLTADDVHRARQAGVAEVLPAGDHALVADRCRQALNEQAAPSVAADAAEGRIVTVVSARAGCGSTTLATNLATAVQLGGCKTACLVDLDLEAGDVATALRLDGSRSIATALEQPADLMLADLLTCSADGLDCVAAPSGAGESSRVGSELIGTVLARLAARYDLVIVDLPARLTAAALIALDRAEHHIVLSTPERPALKNLRRMLDTLDLLGYSRSSRSVVFNRSNATASINAADVEALLRTPVTLHVPSSRDVPTAINRGLALVAVSSDHPVSAAINQLADRLVGHPPRTTPIRTADREIA